MASQFKKVTFYFKMRKPGSSIMGYNPLIQLKTLRFIYCVNRKLLKAKEVLPFLLTMTTQK